MCQKGGAAMRCMTVLNYPDQCMEGKGGDEFQKHCQVGFAHTNVTRGTPFDIIGKGKI